jgi:hypothetical protein
MADRGAAAVLVIAATGNGNIQQMLVDKKQSGDGSKIIALLDNSPSAQLPAGKRSGHLGIDR